MHLEAYFKNVAQDGLKNKFCVILLVLTIRKLGLGCCCGRLIIKIGVKLLNCKPPHKPLNKHLINKGIMMKVGLRVKPLSLSRFTDYDEQIHVKKYVLVLGPLV